MSIPERCPECGGKIVLVRRTQKASRVEVPDDFLRVGVTKDGDLQMTLSAVFHFEARPEDFSDHQVECPAGHVTEYVLDRG